MRSVLFILQPSGETRIVLIPSSNDHIPAIILSCFTRAVLTFIPDWSNYVKSKPDRLDRKPSEEVLMFLFGPVGPTELILIILIIVIIFGARKLPELGKSLGEGIKNFRKSISSKEKESESPPDKPQPPAKEE